MYIIRTTCATLSSPERLVRLELELGDRQAQILDGPPVEPGDVASAPGPLQPIAKKRRERWVE
jgi:hypothetical protein